MIVISDTERTKMTSNSDWPTGESFVGRTYEATIPVDSELVEDIETILERFLGGVLQQIERKQKASRLRASLAGVTCISSEDVSFSFCLPDEENADIVIRDVANYIHQRAKNRFVFEKFEIEQMFKWRPVRIVCETDPLTCRPSGSDLILVRIHLKTTFVVKRQQWTRALREMVTPAT